MNRRTKEKYENEIQNNRKMPQSCTALKKLTHVDRSNLGRDAAGQSVSHHEENF